MESLALFAALIVAPAMFGGPIALLATLWKPEKMSTVRRTVIYTLGIFSSLVGIFLIVENISSGARNVGLLGIATGLFAVLRARNPNKN
jgi:hypothetical protein